MLTIGHSCVLNLNPQAANASFASRALRGDPDVVKVAVEGDGIALKYASARLRADRDIVLSAVGSNGDALAYASDELRADREMVLLWWHMQRAHLGWSRARTLHSRATWGG